MDKKLKSLLTQTQFGDGNSELDSKVRDLSNIVADLIEYISERDSKCTHCEHVRPKYY